MTCHTGVVSRAQQRPHGDFEVIDTPDRAVLTSRGVFSRASAGHKRKSLVKIDEVTPPKRPPILGPLELGEPIDHSGTPPSPPVIYGGIFDPPLKIPTPPSTPLGPWNSGSRSTIQVPPLPPGHLWGDFRPLPPLNFRPPSYPPLNQRWRSDAQAALLALGLKPPDVEAGRP